MKLREQWFIKLETPYLDEISGLAKVKMLHKRAQSTMMLKLKFVLHPSTLDVINSSLETAMIDLKEMLGILDLRLIGYYKIKQGILQQNLSKCYRFKSVDILYEQFHKFINM